MTIGGNLDMNLASRPYILVFGASVIDIIGFSKVKYKKHDSTPGRIKMSFGGVCRNIAENMARVGVKTQLISILGDDEKGYNLLEHAKYIGYDMSNSLVLENKSTPTYMAILDENGEMVSAISLMMKSIDEMSFNFIKSKSEIIENSQFTVVDADSPENLEFILKEFSSKTKFILDPISAAKAERIKHLVKYFHTVKPNRHEAEMFVGFKIKDREDLIKAGDYLLAQGVKNVFISLDEEGIFFTNGKQRGTIKANNVYVKNVTGAGDSFVAGLGYGYYNNLNLEDTIKFSIAMSIITISHEETINPCMNLELVNKTIEETDWEENIF